ncbi:MAG: hypothetical protein JWR26_3452 [Pedosphaera sp.]|nr:hypothetical protein [Pedosphaera sp.]
MNVNYSSWVVADKAGVLADSHRGNRNFDRMVFAHGHCGASPEMLRCCGSGLFGLGHEAISPIPAVASKRGRETRGGFNHRPRVLRDRDHIDHKETGMKTWELHYYRRRAPGARRRSEVPRVGPRYAQSCAGHFAGMVEDISKGAALCKGKWSFRCLRTATTARRRSEVPRAGRALCRSKRSVSKAEARGGIWAAFGWALGGQATNFGRVGSPKCLGVPRGTARCRFFFESFIGVLATTDVGGGFSPQMNTDPACGTGKHRWDCLFGMQGARKNFTERPQTPRAGQVHTDGLAYCHDVGGCFHTGFLRTATMNTGPAGRDTGTMGTGKRQGLSRLIWAYLALSRIFRVCFFGPIRRISRIGRIGYCRFLACGVYLWDDFFVIISM